MTHRVGLVDAGGFATDHGDQLDFPVHVASGRYDDLGVGTGEAGDVLGEYRRHVGRGIESGFGGVRVIVQAGGEHLPRGGRGRTEAVAVNGHGTGQCVDIQLGCPSEDLVPVLVNGSQIGPKTTARCSGDIDGQLGTGFADYQGRPVVEISETH